MAEKLTIQLTEDYRLVSDGTQYIAQERVTVDPTLAVNWSTKVAEARAKGEAEPDGSKYEEWRNTYAPYFSLSDGGIIAAINAIKHRKAVRTKERYTLTEFTEFIRSLHAEMTERISG